MREIKFRAWDDRDDAKKMYYPESSPFLINFSGDLSHNGVFARIGYDLKLMQFTGLLDKNGKEIYEGDILQLKNTKGQISNHQEVYWDSEDACWGWRTANEDSWPDSFSGFYNDYEVIGNIYENQELLKSREGK